MTALNKKVLCFIDESGTAGAGDLTLGAVLVLARDAGRLDRCFTGLLAPGVSEVHAADMDNRYLQSLLRRFRAAMPAGCAVMINQKVSPREGDGPVIYAQAVIETVKIGLKRFQDEVLEQQTIGNVEVIVDHNHHNDHADFRREIERSQTHDGRFKGVKRLVSVDSAASRLLQLADVVAYSRRWVDAGSFDARSLREQFGIQMP